jgi:hypothetical protein
MANTSGFVPTHGAHMSDSAVCGGCHNLKTPFVDENGEVASTTPDREFPEQTPYTEWENSDFGPGQSQERSCQSCHMPPKDGVKLANRPRRLAARDDVAGHEFLGANTLMLEILGEHADQLGVPATDFEASIERTRDFLREGVELEVVSAAANNGQLDLAVRVINRTGHKFPTSFPSRRAFLHVTVTDSQGRVAFESGQPRLNGSIVGLDADMDLRSYEPHHEVITSENQVQVYEPVMSNTQGEVTYTLLRGATYLKDNRIPPAGFDKQIVPDEIAVAGFAKFDPDFTGGSDTVRYRVPVAQSGSWTVRVDLNYQALGYAFAQDLRQDDADPTVARFLGYYDAAGNKTETIATTEVLVSR